MCQDLVRRRLVPRSRGKEMAPVILEQLRLRRPREFGSASDLMDSTLAGRGPSPAQPCQPLAARRRLAAFSTDRAAQVCESPLPDVFGEPCPCRIAAPHQETIRLDPCRRLRVRLEEEPHLSRVLQHGGAGSGDDRPGLLPDLLPPPLVPRCAAHRNCVERHARGNVPFRERPQLKGALQERGKAPVSGDMSGDGPLLRAAHAPARDEHLHRRVIRQAVCVQAASTADRSVKP